MGCPTHNGFVNINVPVPDLQVVAAIRVSTNPGFVVNSCPLIAKIRQGYQVSGLALLALGEIKLFHLVHLPTKIGFFIVYTKQWLLTRVCPARLS